jgi:HEAT repeat protein
VKEHAVFAITQLPAERSVPLLIDLVKTHKNRKVRERALFWLAQSGDDRAIDLIESILTK